MTMLPKEIYRFNAILIKITTKFITDFEITILNFKWKNRKLRIAKTILCNPSGEINIPDIKLYYRAMVRKTAWY